MPQLPLAILPLILPFAALFSRPTWEHMQVLLGGTLLCQGPRTVAAVLRAMGLHAEPRFEKYHRTLNRARWSGLRGAQILLGLLIKLLPPQWPITVGVDETLERRKGQRIAAKGVYRDAVRSSKSKVVTCFGLQWICMALLIPLPWSQRPWALPFLTLLAPSERANQRAGKPHRSAIDWTIVMVRVVARWLQRRPWILIGDGAYACVLLGWECLSAQATLISRLRLDARLFAPPQPVPAGAPRPQAPRKAPRWRSWQRALRKRCARARTSPSAGIRAPKPCACSAGSASGTRPLCPRCPSVGCWSSIPPANSPRKPSSAPNRRCPRSV